MTTTTSSFSNPIVSAVFASNEYDQSVCFKNSPRGAVLAGDHCCGRSGLPRSHEGAEFCVVALLARFNRLTDRLLVPSCCPAKVADFIGP
jgi:hypothetical protein